MRKTSKYVLFTGVLEKEHSEAVQEWNKALGLQSLRCAEMCKHSLEIAALTKMGASCSQKLLRYSFMAMGVLTPAPNSVIYRVLWIGQARALGWMKVEINLEEASAEQSEEQTLF